ncbi:MAG: ATP-binding cassette domain-containing protein, partial [Solirubrobacteraceae bacterium]
MSSPVLAVRGLRTSFDTSRGRLPAVDRVDLELFGGETLGVVGESGCGKSVTALSILRLLPMPPAAIEAGEILFEGRNLLELSDEEMRRIRGNRIAMIFQEPMTSLNPAFTIGNQIAESVRVHRKASRREAWARAVEM